MVDKYAEMPLTADEDRHADFQFIDDLLAAARLKTFLLGEGVEIPSEISIGLARLIEFFSRDIDHHEDRHFLTEKLNV